MTSRACSRQLAVRLAALTFVFLVGALSQQPAASRQPSTQAAAYLEQALSTMQERYVYRSSVDWPALRLQAFNEAAGAEQPPDTYEAIRHALGKLRDRHCRLLVTNELAEIEATRRKEKHLPPVPPRPTLTSAFRDRTEVDHRVLKVQDQLYGFIVVPMFTEAIGTDFATKIQAALQEMMHQRVGGFIVDLRGNRGGNMWPMLAGLGPIVGEGMAGKFVDRNQDIISEWFYKEGKAWSSNSKPSGTEISGAAVVMSSQLPVAVLIDQVTGSSGEAIAIAFKGRPSTRFFGTNTSGAASSPISFTLADGATMVLAGAASADRNGHTYEGGIQPDDAVEYSIMPPNSDSVIEKAARWLGTQVQKKSAGK